MPTRRTRTAAANEPPSTAITFVLRGVADSATPATRGAAAAA
jgi:hypothetical protein